MTAGQGIAVLVFGFRPGAASTAVDLVATFVRSNVDSVCVD